MKPTTGRIVHVFVPPHHNNGSDVAPAVITRVWPGDLVNLRILHDGPTVAPDGQHRIDWMTSVPVHESREAADAAGQSYAAFWPPRFEHEAGDRPVRF